MLTVDMLQKQDGVRMASQTRTSMKSNAVVPLQKLASINIMMQIPVSTPPEDALVDGEKVLMQGDPSLRRDPLYAKLPPEGLPNVPECALLRRDREAHG